eukprot:282402-Chlamydomonas_euryale.AAC.4
MRWRAARPAACNRCGQRAVGLPRSWAPMTTKKKMLGSGPCGILWLGVEGTCRAVPWGGPSSTLKGSLAEGHQTGEARAEPARNACEGCEAGGDAGQYLHPADVFYSKTQVESERSCPSLLPQQASMPFSCMQRRWICFCTSGSPCCWSLAVSVTLALALLVAGV